MRQDNITMFRKNTDELEKEYMSFMTKLADKAKEIRQDFEKLSPENKERIKNDVTYIAISKVIGQKRNL